jgi:hypothetical protein
MMRKIPNQKKKKKKKKIKKNSNKTGYSKAYMLTL